ncbi:MAG TPA: 50S ribosomal protein L10 [bacterium]|nr:50S ribosomal protein L10 [bacterium]HPN41902.1 50S ribosomal protein L10 [bacterium]
MPQSEKQLKVEEITASLSKAKSVFMTDFSGMTVEELTSLRRELRKVDVSYIVVKNTLARKSATQLGMEKMNPYLVGPTGLAIANNDPIAPSRVIFDFQKTKKKLAIKAAILEGQFLDKQAAEDIRNIPGKEQLIGMVVGGIAAPLTGLVGGLQAMLRQLVTVVSAIKDKKE